MIAHLIDISYNIKFLLKKLVLSLFMFIIRIAYMLYLNIMFRNSCFSIKKLVFFHFLCYFLNDF